MFDIAHLEQFFILLSLKRVKCESGKSDKIFSEPGKTYKSDGWRLYCGWMGKGKLFTKRTIGQALEEREGSLSMLVRS